MHVSSGFKTLTDELVSSFKLIELLEANIPRPVNAVSETGFMFMWTHPLSQVATLGSGVLRMTKMAKIHPSPLRLIKRENQKSKSNHL